jgi:peptidoglycan/xylan/chitin deacetylase (PgdA/CDA1 family)
MAERGTAPNPNVSEYTKCGRRGHPRSALGRLLLYFNNNLRLGRLSSALTRLSLLTIATMAGCAGSSAPTGPQSAPGSPELAPTAVSAPLRPDIVAQFCANHALVTFVIDDGWITDYTIKKPIFDAHGAVGVLAIISTKRRLSDAWLLEMQAAGWEIASHTRTHRDLTTLHGADLENEIGGSKAELEAIGLHVNAFVFPYGRGNRMVRLLSRQYYDATAQIGHGFNRWDRKDPTDLGREIFGAQYARPDQHSLPFYEAEVDSARKAGRWLIFAVHQLIENDAQDLSALLDDIQAKSVPIVTITQGFALRRACPFNTLTHRQLARHLWRRFPASP